MSYHHKPVFSVFQELVITYSLRVESNLKMSVHDWKQGNSRGKSYYENVSKQHNIMLLDQLAQQES